MRCDKVRLYHYIYSVRYIQFFTATILNWQHLLKDDACKNIIMAAVKHRVQLEQVKVYGYVIMPNHIHFLWYIDPAIDRSDFQRDFLKYVSAQLIIYLKSNGRQQDLRGHVVNAKDRKLQIWERNALSIDIYSQEVFNQKLTYIHNNPLQEKWQLARYPEEYRYSSSRFYVTGVDEFGVLSRLL